MRIALIAAVLAAGTALATPAFAQDGDAHFTGPRAEAIVGWDRVTDGSDGSQIGTDGVVYGGAVGYDAQMGGVVVGVEGEITGSSAKIRANDLLTAGDRLRVSAGRDLYAGARLGYVISPQAMIYAKAGYTNARLEAKYAVGSTTIENHEDLDGYRLGAGIEYNVGPTTYVKAEYRYSHYGDLDGYDIDANRHQVLAGVGVRF